MNVATIRMAPKRARQALETYRARRVGKLDEEYQRVEAAYAELAKGTPLLILSDVIANAPRDGRGRPMLAIARADRPQVKYERAPGWSFEQFSTAFQGGMRAHRDGTLQVPRLADVTPRIDAYLEGYALVPLVPPDVRLGHDLSKRFVLWEVEAWADRAISSQPDRDPYLLRRIGADLYAVVGAWDLTDVERAIMRDRARI